MIDRKNIVLQTGGDESRLLHELNREVVEEHGFPGEIVASGRRDSEKLLRRLSEIFGGYEPGFEEVFFRRYVTRGVSQGEIPAPDLLC